MPQEIRDVVLCDHKKPRPNPRDIISIMPAKRRRVKRRRQKGDILPLAALIPALIAGGKAVTLGAASGAASYNVKKGLDAATRGKRKKRAATPAEIQRFKRGLLVEIRAVSWEDDYKRMSVKGVTCSYNIPSLWKYESIASSTSVPEEHSQRSQSKSTSCHAGTHRCRSNQRHQRDDSQFVEKMDPRRRSDLWEIEKT